jgi:hypothetical protein
MYSVVGCDECQALWIVEGRPETSQCPRCGKTRGFEKRRQFVTTDDEDHAREVRASMLAARQGHGDDFADLDSFAEMEEYVDEAGIDDETYLEESGIDPGDVAAAGERTRGPASGEASSQKSIVRKAVRDLDGPTESAILSYSEERGVEPDRARRVLEKLVRSGEVTENGGEYRLL